MALSFATYPNRQTNPKSDTAMPVCTHRRCRCNAISSNSLLRITSSKNEVVKAVNAEPADEKLAAATTYVEEDYKQYNELKARYDHLMHEWEKASYELEITEQG